MFIGNMVTEAIPARVYALYKIVAGRKNVKRVDIQNMMEPPELNKGTSYFSTIFKAATELKLIAVQDDLIVPMVPKDQMKNMRAFRQHVIRQLGNFEQEQFFKVSNILVNMNEQVYQYSLTDPALLNLLTEGTGGSVTAPMIRGWRFWAQFLGFGYIYKMSFLPNAYIFVKNVLRLLELEKDEEYEIDDFMLRFKAYGSIISNNMLPERSFNMALSQALRELHEKKELELQYRSDAKMRWNLYPSQEFNIKQIASIRYKGVRE